MPHLVLERVFDEPLSRTDFLAGVRRTDWCFEMYRVDWLGSFLSTDGRTLVCTFRAPDVESARNALTKAEADMRRLWTTSVHEALSTGTPPVVPNVIVERTFPAPDTFERLQAAVVAKSWCFEQRRVRWARSYLSTDGRRMLCLYEAPDVEAVRAAQREAELPVAAVWAFERIGPD
jgi:hypothetical protein